MGCHPGTATTVHGRRSRGSREGAAGERGPGKRVSKELRSTEAKAAAALRRCPLCSRCVGVGPLGRQPVGNSKAAMGEESVGARGGCGTVSL